MMILVFAITIGLQLTDESTAQAGGRVRGIWYFRDIASAYGGFPKGSEDYFIDKWGRVRHIDTIDKGAWFGRSDYYEANLEDCIHILRNADFSISCMTGLGLVQIWRYNGYYFYIDRTYIDSRTNYFKDPYVYPLSQSSGYYDVVRSYFAREERLKRESEERKRKQEEAEREKIIRAAEAEIEAQRRKVRFNELIAEGDKDYNAKNYENSLKAYQKAREYNSQQVDGYCNELIKNGDKLANQERYDEAYDYYKKAGIMGSKSYEEGINKINSALKIEEAEKFRKDGLYNKAIESFNKALSLKTNEDMIYNKLGLTYFDMEDNENALKYFDLAKNCTSPKKPLYREIIKKLHNLYIKKGEYYEAYKVCENYLELDFVKKAPEKWMKWTYVDKRLNPQDKEIANLYWEAGIFSALERGNKLYEEKKYKKAFQDYEIASDFCKYRREYKLKKYDDTIDVKTYYTIANAYEKIKKYDVGLKIYSSYDQGAIYYYKKCIEFTPKLEPGVSNATIDPKDKDKITIIDGNGQTAVVKDTMLVSSYNKNYRGRLGRIYFKMKNYTEALKYFDDAINNYQADYFDDFSDPNSNTGDNNIYNMRGQCNEQLQKYEAALKDYEEALIFEPENKKIIKAKQRVEKLLNKK